MRPIAYCVLRNELQPRQNGLATRNSLPRSGASTKPVKTGNGKGKNGKGKRVISVKSDEGKLFMERKQETRTID